MEGKAPQRLRAVGLQLPEANTIKRLNLSVLTESDNVKAVGAAVPCATSEDGVVQTSETSVSRRNLSLALDRRHGNVRGASKPVRSPDFF